MRNVFRVAAVVMVATFAAFGTTAQAQAGGALPPQTEDVATEAMSRLRSPYTASHTVDMCPSAGALRDSIRVAAASGQSTEQIVEDVIARHGEQLRLLPKGSGAGIWAWILPPLVLLMGGAAVAYRLRNRSGADGKTPSDGPGVSDAEREEIAAAMREWETRGEVRV